MRIVTSAIGLSSLLCTFWYVEIHALRCTCRRGHGWPASLGTCAADSAAASAATAASVTKSFVGVVWANAAAVGTKGGSCRTLAPSCCNAQICVQITPRMS